MGITKKVLDTTVQLALRAGSAREALIEHLLALHLERAAKAVIARVQRAAQIGFLCAYMGTEDTADAATLLDKPVKGLTEEEVRLRARARSAWRRVMDELRERRPEIAPQKSAAKVEAAKAANAKRGRGPVAKAAKTEAAKTAEPAAKAEPAKPAKPATRENAVAHLHQGAAALLAFVAANKATLGGAITKRANDLLKQIMAISPRD